MYTFTHRCIHWHLFISLSCSYIETYTLTHIFPEHTNTYTPTYLHTHIVTHTHAQSNAYSYMLTLNTHLHTFTNTILHTHTYSYTFTDILRSIHSQTHTYFHRVTRTHTYRYNNTGWLDFDALGLDAQRPHKTGRDAGASGYFLLSLTLPYSWKFPKCPENPDSHWTLPATFCSLEPSGSA